MKRIISLLLAITLTFALVACSNNADSTADKAFVKPEKYSTVLLVSINPQFKLYLDDQDNVLAVEPINKDAKEVVNGKKFSGKLENVIEEIVNKSNDAGFVKEDAKINLQIVETKKEQTKAESILSVAKDAATKTFEEIDVTVEIETSIAESATSSSDAQSTSTESATSSPDAQSTSTESASSVANTSSVASTHAHKYSAATCTKAATCSCGATNGKALGHNYSNGTCTRCKEKDPNYKTPTYTSVKTKACKWTFMFVSSDGTLYDGALTLNQTVPTIGATLGDKIEPDMPEAQDAITFEGNLYYCGRGTGPVPLKSVTEDGTTITVTDTINRKLVLTRIDENTLKVVSSLDGFGDEEGWTAIEDIPKSLILKAE